MKASIRELRSKTKQIMSAVQRGETVIISNRGKSYAQITAIPKAAESVREPEAAYGMWGGHKDKKDVKAHIDHLRKARHAR